MNGYNIIPVGDNCMVAEILRDLGLRKCSYPFDWISHTNYYNATNIVYNFGVIERLMKGTFTVSDFLGNDPIKIHNNIWFPHEEDCYKTTVEKYKRRFDRLHTDISTKKNLFIFLTRHYLIPESDFDKIVAQVLSYNRENKILYIHGSPHTYLMKPKYRYCVAYQHLFYDVSKLTKEMEYEYEYYRPWVKSYIASLEFIRQ